MSRHDGLDLLIGVDGENAAGQLDITIGGSSNSSPRLSLLSLALYMRSLRMCNSASLIIPLRPSKSLSL